MLPILTPSDIAVLRQAEAHYAIGLAGCPDGTIERLMAGLSTLFPDSKLTDEEADARLTLYTRLLRDLPADILADAFERVARTKTFFPAVAEIREAAQKTHSARIAMQLGCRRLIFKHDRDYQPEQQAGALDPSEVEEANRLMRKLRLRTRYREDGTPFMLAENAPDPATPEVPADA